MMRLPPPSDESDQPQTTPRQVTVIIAHAVFAASHAFAALGHCYFALKAIACAIGRLLSGKR
jgi:hypothetical protein